MQQKRVAVLGDGGEMEGAAALRGSENREGRRKNRSRAEQMSLRNRYLMRIQWPRFTGSPPIHPLSKPDM